MNERIRELWDRSKTSGVHPEFGEYDKYSAEKFAELIVKECANQATWHQDTKAKDIGGELLKYFGVEE